MHRSNNRILTTHVGSLPRPPALRDLLIRYERGESIDMVEFQRQIEAGCAPGGCEAARGGYRHWQQW